MNRFKVLALPCFAVCAVVGYFFVETLVLPQYSFDDKGLLKASFVILLSAFLGVIFWIRGTEFEKRAKSFRKMLVFASVVYGICLFAILFGSVDITRKNAGIQSYSLVPFRTISGYLRASQNGTVSRSVVWENLIGNLLLFCPVGFIAPFLFVFLQEKKWFCICMITMLCGVEFLQFVTSRGSMDIDDVILNFVGAAFVYLFAWNERMINVWYDIGVIEDDVTFLNS